MYNIYYLNNHGSRWVMLDKNNKKPKYTFETKNGNKVTRTAILFESFGNFATMLISYKGKKIKVFADEILEN